MHFLYFYFTVQYSVSICCGDTLPQTKCAYTVCHLPALFTSAPCIVAMPLVCAPTLPLPGLGALGIPTIMPHTHTPVRALTHTALGNCEQTFVPLNHEHLWLLDRLPSSLFIMAHCLLLQMLREVLCNEAPDEGSWARSLTSVTGVGGVPAYCWKSQVGVDVHSAFSNLWVFFLIQLKLTSYT